MSLPSLESSKTPPCDGKPFRHTAEVDYHYLDGLLDYIELPANQGSSSNRRRTRFTHDDVGRVLQVLSKVAASSEQMRVRHEYDGRSNLKKLIRLRNSLEKTYQFSYDALNRPTQLQDPLAAVRAVAYDPHCRNYTATSARGLETMVKRDSRCQVTEIVNADEKREFDYDEWGRLITVTTTQNPLSRYVDPNNPPTDHPRARYGQVRYGPPATPQVTRYLYDALSRLVKITYPDNQIVEYAYNAEGQLIEVTDMLGQKTQYSYYNDGRLYQVTVVATPSNQVFTYLYDAAGRVSEIQYPTATGVVAKFSDASNNSGWDANGRLLHLRYLQAGNLLQGYQYSYDASGNRTQMVEQPGSGPSITWDYGYDWLDRLISVKKDTVTQSLYAYDESDNRVELQWPVLSQTHAYAYDDANRLTSRTLNGSTAETFSHDADGNMIARTAGGQTTHYRWDAFDKLIRRESASLTQSYGYDVEGLRKSTGTNTKNYHSGGVSLADQRPSGSISFLQGHQILGMKQDGAFYWYLPDHLGTVRQVIDNSGSVVATTSLDEFGRELSSSGSADRRLHTYTGSLGVRQEDGLYLAGQRWFDPGLGRWLNPDPIGFAGGLNLFEYANSSPVNFVDPDGLEPEFTTEQLETLTSGLGLYNDFLIGELGGRVFSELLALLKFRTICPPRYPRLIRGDGRSMVKQTTNELKFINPAARPQATRDFLNQVKNLNPRWSFSEENAVDGASVFRGGAGEAILIDRQGRVYRGNVNDLPDPGAGPYSGWEGVFREVVPYQPGFRSSY